MNKVNQFLLMLIAMAAIMLVTVCVDRGMKYYEYKQWEEERVVFYQEAKAEIADMQATIQTLSDDPEALNAYIAENDVSDSIVSDNILSDSIVSENDVSDSSVSGNILSDSSVSGNILSDSSVSVNTVSGNLLLNSQVSGNGLKTEEPCASYEKTIQINYEDRKLIENSFVDFSDKKIACLGDSITAATNLEGQEDYLKSSYPYQLGEILGVKEIINLGIGGSSLGRYWENAFVDRYQEIPEDTDIIIVMGGTNDGLCASKTELGSLEKRKKNTFAGDLDELFRRLKKDYPNAEIVLVTPPSNVLQDIYRKSRTFLCPQAAIINTMTQLAAEYEIPVIDLYGSGILDSHDTAVIHAFLPDGVHGNKAGYRILAEHIAAELIKLQEAEITSDAEEKGAGADEQ